MALVSLLDTMEMFEDPDVEQNNPIERTRPFPGMSSFPRHREHSL
jgi:hypothetical protein